MNEYVFDNVRVLGYATFVNEADRSYHRIRRGVGHEEGTLTYPVTEQAYTEPSVLSSRSNIILNILQVNRRLQSQGRGKLGGVKRYGFEGRLGGHIFGRMHSSIAERLPIVGDQLLQLQWYYWKTLIPSPVNKVFEEAQWLSRCRRSPPNRTGRQKYLNGWTFLETLH